MHLLMPFLTIDNGQNCEIKLFELKEMYIKIPISLQFHKSKKKHHKNFRITFFSNFVEVKDFLSNMVSVQSIYY